MKFVTNTLVVAAATISFFAVATSVVANDDSRGRLIRGRNELSHLEQENDAFWSRGLQMSVENEFQDSHDGDDHNEDDDSCQNTPHPVDPEVVRAALKEFVKSLDDAPLGTDFDNEGGPSQLARAYHPNADEQVGDYHFCTIVQQCLDPDFVLAFGHLTGKQRGLAYASASAAMSTEAFTMLQLQEHSNMLLGEMQDWATTCDGTCRLLDDTGGLLKKDYTLTSTFAEQSTEIPDTSYHGCGIMQKNGNKTFWYCNDVPRMIHVGSFDVEAGQYSIGNVWQEPRIHARNAWHNFISVYGNLEPNGGKFGMRLTGHHTDVNYRWDEKGVLVQDTPVFLGHNPFIVPPTTPPMTRESNERADASDFYFPLMWQNMAGVQQFAESERLVLAASNTLETAAQKAFIPLKELKQVSFVGLLQPRVGIGAIESLEYWDLSTADKSDFDSIWALVEYTLKFSRGNQPTVTERNTFRTEGKVIWTTTFPHNTNPETEFDTNWLPVSKEDFRENLNFVNIWIETDKLLFSLLINAQFTVVSEFEPSNHLHSVLVEKALINDDHACMSKPNDKCPDLKYTCDEENDPLCDGYSGYHTHDHTHDHSHTRLVGISRGSGYDPT